VCVLAVGKLVGNAVAAVERLAEQGIAATIWDVRCCRPLDPQMIADAARHDVVVTYEDGVREGGVGMMIADAVQHAADTPPRVEVCGVPVKFIPQAKPDLILTQLGLDADGMVATISALVR
jgi:1-deoxy-D-xylulose-5-phosphate synthase